MAAGTINLGGRTVKVNGQRGCKSRNGYLQALNFQVHATVLPYVCPPPPPSPLFPLPPITVNLIEAPLYRDDVRDPLLPRAGKGDFPFIHHLHIHRDGTELRDFLPRYSPINTPIYITLLSLALSRLHSISIHRLHHASTWYGTFSGMTA